MMVLHGGRPRASLSTFSPPRGSQLFSPTGRALLALKQGRRRLSQTPFVEHDPTGLTRGFGVGGEWESTLEIEIAF
jgi:hypothetical protein